MSGRRREALLAGGAVLVTAVAGCTAEDPGPRAANTSASSTANPGDAVPLAGLPANSALDPGRYVFSVLDARTEPPLSPVLTVPEGYAALEDGMGVGADGLERYLWVWDVDSVYAHPCDPAAQPVGPTVADLAEALAAQQLRETTDPVPVTIGGYSGLHVELAVPAEVDDGDCPGGVFHLWPGRLEGAQDILGQVDMVWIVDVDGQRLLFDAAHLPTASPDEVAALREMVTTATFAPA